MPPLCETQAWLRRAVVLGDTSSVAPFVTEPGRLEIHRRHYEASLVEAILCRFPATAWLVGGSRLSDAARSFVREHPPVSACVAEYGGRFPSYLATRPWAAALPYLESFARLDSALGEVAISIDGVRRVESAWPIDTLIAHFLNDDAPEQLVFEAEEVRLEIHGGRGSFEIIRLDIEDEERL